MKNKNNFKTEIRSLKTGKVLNINNKDFLENINEIAKEFANYYHYYYYIPTLCETFNGKYAYFYKDVYTKHLIKVAPENFDKRLDILKERVDKLNLKNALFIGFLVPYFE